MKFSIKLIESESFIRTQILQAIRDRLNKALSVTAQSIKSDISILIREALQSEPEFSSLLSGQLRKEFGIEDTGNVYIVVDAISNSVQTNVKTVSINNTGVSGGLQIQLVGPGYGGALADSSAQVMDSERGYSLPWLEWLLLKGNQIIIRKYEVKLGENPRSRSGDAIMIPSGTSWRVPPEFAGTERDNWVTRALGKIDNKITNLIQTKFESSI